MGHPINPNTVQENVQSSARDREGALIKPDLLAHACGVMTVSTVLTNDVTNERFITRSALWTQLS